MDHPGLEHPYARFVAIGDSFTEGVGDDEPSLPNGVRGWADRVAEELARTRPDIGYANLAIRGRRLPQIVEEQVEPALALEPDLVAISAGGNDLLRPSGDPDALAVTVSIDGAVVHRHGTAGRVRGVAALIADVSAFMTLHPGDVLLLGRSHGVPRVRAGQSVAIAIEGLGTLHSRVVAEAAEGRSSATRGEAA